MIFRRVYFQTTSLPDTIPIMEEEFKSGFVAVVGQPNVGKSTLINAFMGQKIAAVTPRPQTTRKQQLGILSSENAQIIFTDTPGIHIVKHKLGNYMNEEALMALEDSDVVLFLVDVSRLPDAADEMIGEALSKLKHTPIVLGLNKVDLISDDDLATNTEAYLSLVNPLHVQNISARKNQNLDELLDVLISQLPENPPFFPDDQITDAYERDLAADLIRESALIILRDEVPHGIAVRINEFTERGDTGAYIAATMLVERDSQKGIVIGHKGKMIKQLSTRARQEIEKMSGRKVFLELRVKVRKNWRNDEKVLKSFGFKNRK